MIAILWAAWIAGVVGTSSTGDAVTLPRPDVYADEFFELTTQPLHSRLAPGETVITDAVLKNVAAEPVRFNAQISLYYWGSNPSEAVQDSMALAREQRAAQARRPVAYQRCRPAKPQPIQIDADPVDLEEDWITLESGDSIVVRLSTHIEVPYDVDAAFRAEANFYCTRRDCDLEVPTTHTEVYSRYFWVEFRRRVP